MLSGRAVGDAGAAVGRHVELVGASAAVADASVGGAQLRRGRQQAQVRTAAVVRSARVRVRDLTSSVNEKKTEQTTKAKHNVRTW